jgi:hypothetical protein
VDQSRGITYGNAKVCRYCDADHAGALTRATSTTGAVTVLHGGAVDWSSTLQSTVAASTCEAAGVVVRMALWLRKILTDLGLTPKGGRQQRSCYGRSWWTVTIRVQLLC